AAVEKNLRFYRRIATRVQDFPCLDRLDGRHRLMFPQPGGPGPLLFNSLLTELAGYLYYTSSNSASPRRLTALSISLSISSRLRMRASGQELGPSLNAASGRGWVSMNTPQTPAATAARASTGMNSRWP